MTKNETETAIANIYLDAAIVSSGYRNIYSIGPYGSRINFSSQQSRAYNLAWALHKTNTIEKDFQIAVVGAGLAGATCAITLASLGYSVNIFETLNEPIAGDMRTASHRVVHPTLNRWPFSPLSPVTDFPDLNWGAGICSNILDGLASHIKTRIKVLDISESYKVNITEVEHHRNRVKLSWVVDDDIVDKKFSTVIIATGFGVEKDIDGYEYHSYWQRDNLESVVTNSAIESNHGVSGIGDGALIDCFRILCANKFENGYFILKFLGLLKKTKKYESIKRQIKVAEEHASTLFHSPYESDLPKIKDNVSEELHRAYKKIAKDVTGEAEDYLFNAVFRDTEGLKNSICLVGRQLKPFSIFAAPIHKLVLAYYLDHRFIKYKIDTSDRSESSNGFGIFVKRHGAKPPITNILPDLDENKLIIRQTLLFDRLELHSVDWNQLLPNSLEFCETDEQKYCVEQFFLSDENYSRFEKAIQYLESVGIKGSALNESEDKKIILIKELLTDENKNKLLLLGGAPEVLYGIDVREASTEEITLI